MIIANLPAILHNKDLMLWNGQGGGCAPLESPMLQPPDAHSVHISASLVSARYAQVDMLQTEDEVDQVLGFVSSNASKLLQLDNPAVLPISGRAALKAKLQCGSGRTGGVLDSWEDDLLITQPSWMASRCGAACLHRA